MDYVQANLYGSMATFAFVAGQSRNHAPVVNVEGRLKLPDGKEYNNKTDFSFQLSAHETAELAAFLSGYVDLVSFSRPSNKAFGVKRNADRTIHVRGSVLANEAWLTLQLKTKPGVEIDLLNVMYYVLSSAYPHVPQNALFVHIKNTYSILNQNTNSGAAR